MASPPSDKSHADGEMLAVKYMKNSSGPVTMGKVLFVEDYYRLGANTNPAGIVLSVKIATNMVS